MTISNQLVSPYLIISAYQQRLVRIYHPENWPPSFVLPPTALYQIISNPETPDPLQGIAYSTSLMRKEEKGEGEQEAAFKTSQGRGHGPLNAGAVPLGH